MTIWALADLHLSFGVPNKEMSFFGERWAGHPGIIRDNWLKVIKPEDLVLLPGDISWAMHPEEAVPDLKWIDALPGTKVMIRGNHDYWWSSVKKLKEILPPSIHLVQNDVFRWGSIAVCGARLWDTPEFTFDGYVHMTDNPRANKLIQVEEPEAIEKIFLRELGRLELSLKCLPKDPKIFKIAMVHYPPIGPDLKPTRASALLEKYGVNACVFGHLHNVNPGTLPFGTKNGITYTFVACDYVKFMPIEIRPPLQV